MSHTRRKRISVGRLPSQGHDIRIIDCEHCGRTWETRGPPTGFVVSGAENHVLSCMHMTPEQRRQETRRALRKWLKHEPRAARISVWDPDCDDCGGER